MAQVFGVKSEGIGFESHKSQDVGKWFLITNKSLDNSFIKHRDQETPQSPLIRFTREAYACSMKSSWTEGWLDGNAETAAAAMRMKKQSECNSLGMWQHCKPIGYSTLPSLMRTQTLRVNSIQEPISNESAINSK